MIKKKKGKKEKNEVYFTNICFYVFFKKNYV